MNLCGKGIEIVHYIIKLVKGFREHSLFCSKCEFFEIKVLVRRKREYVEDQAPIATEMEGDALVLVDQPESSFDS